jgi:hypothetical protein
VAGYAYPGKYLLSDSKTKRDDLRVDTTFNGRIGKGKLVPAHIKGKAFKKNKTQKGVFL